MSVNRKRKSKVTNDGAHDYSAKKQLNEEIDSTTDHVMCRICASSRLNETCLLIHLIHFHFKVCHCNIYAINRIQLVSNTMSQKSNRSRIT